MATTISNEYDHIDIVAGSNTNRHYFKDRVARDAVADLQTITEHMPPYSIRAFGDYSTSVGEYAILYSGKFKLVDAHGKEIARMNESTSFACPFPSTSSGRPICRICWDTTETSIPIEIIADMNDHSPNLYDIGYYNSDKDYFLGIVSDADIKAKDSVRYNTAQNLTSAQKTQARTNIGAADAESVDDIVLVQDTQPVSEHNKIWIRPESDEYKVPTWEEHNELKSAIDNIVTVETTTSTNLLNPANITTGKFYKTTTVDGRVMMIQSENSAFSCAYIDIVSGHDYSLTGISYTAYNGDADGYAIGQACPTNTSITNPTLVTDDVQQNYGNTDKAITRLYFSWRHATYSTDSYMANAGATLLPYEAYFTPTTETTLCENVIVPASNIQPPVLPETYTVDINGGGDYTSFTACLVALKDNTNEKIIYIKPGVYDVFEEIGGATFAAQVEAERQASPSTYNWYDCSTVVPPHTKIIGIGEVVLDFKPEASEITTQVMSLLSPVNVIYDIYMENITIDCDNCRYGIHDETGHIEGVTGTRHIYKNVKIIKTQTDGGMNSAFGCGMQKNQYMEFDGCDFSSPNRPYSFHNKGTGGAVDNTIIVIKNCIARTSNASGNALRFGNVNGYQVMIDVRVFNSYLYGSNVWIGNESSTERPNAYNLTIVGCGNPTVTIESATNIYTPTILQIG